MAGMLPPVVATLLLENKDFNAKIDESEGKLQAFGRSTNGLGSKISSVMGKVSTGILGAAAVAGAYSLKMAADFQTATTTLVTGAGESAKNLDMVRKGLIALGGKVGETPMALVKGMYMIESAGYHGAEGLKVLKAAAEGAAIGGADMQTVADALTTTMHDYQIPASRATQATSALIATVASGKTHLQDLANALGRVLPTASALKIPMDNLLGSVAALTNAGFSARLATTDLNNTIVSLVAPASKAGKTMTEFGLSSQELTNAMKDPHIGLNGALQMVIDAVGKRFPAGSSEYMLALKAMLGGTMGLKVALDLTGAASKTVAQNTQAIGAAMSGSASNVQGWSKVQQDLSFKLHALGASLQGLAINAGDWLLPKATKVADWLTGLVKDFQNSASLRQGLATGFEAALTIAGAVKAAQIGSKIAIAFGADASLAGIAGPIGAAIGVGILSAIKVGGGQNWSDLVTGKGVGRKKAGENILGHFWNDTLGLIENAVKTINTGHISHLWGSYSLPDWISYHDTSGTKHRGEVYGPTRPGGTSHWHVRVTG